MCQKCVEAVKKYYPHLPEDKYGDLLMSATGFPFVSVEIVEEQVKKLAEKTDGTIEAAVAYANHLLDEEMRQFYELQKVKT